MTTQTRPSLICWCFLTISLRELRRNFSRLFCRWTFSWMWRHLWQWGCYQTHAAYGNIHEAFRNSLLELSRVSALEIERFGAFSSNILEFFWCNGLLLFLCKSGFHSWTSCTLMWFPINEVYSSLQGIWTQPIPGIWRSLFNCFYHSATLNPARNFEYLCMDYNSRNIVVSRLYETLKIHVTVTKK